MTSALTVSHVTKDYATYKGALKGIDLEVQSGEFFAILGPNGAGKSTLINIIAQVVHMTTGHIEIFGTSLLDHPQQAKMNIGVMPQEVALDSFFSVTELLQNHSGYYGIRENNEHINYLLKNLDLWEHRDKNTRSLSGGMKRRLMVAKALVHKPKLLILDEPTAGVDVELRHQLWKFVRELHRQGTTIILTTHYLEEAQELANRVAIVDKGELVALDTTKKLLDDFGTRHFEILLTQEQSNIPEFLQKFVHAENSKRICGEFSPELSPDLFQWLASNTGIIEDIRIEEAQLEEVFLRLTRKK